MKLGEYTDLRIPYIVSAALTSVDLNLKRRTDDYILSVMEAFDGNVSLTAKRLGMHRRSLQRYLRRK